MSEFGDVVMYVINKEQNHAVTYLREMLPKMFAVKDLNVGVQNNEQQ